MHSLEVESPPFPPGMDSDTKSGVYQKKIFKVAEVVELVRFKQFNWCTWQDWMIQDLLEKLAVVVCPTVCHSQMTSDQK